MRPLLLALLLGLGLPAPVHALCLLACDVVVTGPEAADRVAALLGSPLPPGTAATGLLVGGFQDAYVQARLSVDDAALADVLILMGVRPDDLTAQPKPYLGGPGPDWFAQAGFPGIKAAEGAIEGFASVTVAVAPEPGGEGRRAVWLWAFAT